MQHHTLTVTFWIRPSTPFTPDYHSSNLPNIVAILCVSRTLGATQVMVTSFLIWLIDPLTNPKAIAFMTMNSTCSRGMLQVFCKVSKEMTLLLLGKLKASSRKAISLIFCSSFCRLFFSSSCIGEVLRGRGR